jgi:uncharacterized protein YjbJ (UPF0337 family)
MQNDTFQERWTEIKGRIQSKWGKFTSREIESLNENLDELAGTIQKVYGYAKERAEWECHEFRISLRPLLHPTVATKLTKR